MKYRNFTLIFMICFVRSVENNENASFQVPEWNVLLLEAGQDENYVMDIPLLANMLQFTEANWKYKTVPSNNYCLGWSSFRSLKFDF